MARSAAPTIGMRSAPLCGHRPYEVARRLVVALAAAGAVHDGPGPVHRGFDPLAGHQVTGQELDALLGRSYPPAEHPYLSAGRPQPWYDLAAEGAGTAGDQGWRCHGFLRLSLDTR